MHKCTRISHEISPEINFKQCVILINEIKLRLRSYLPTYLLRFGDLLHRLPTIISRRSLDRYKQPWTYPGGAGRAAESDLPLSDPEPGYAHANIHGGL